MFLNCFSLYWLNCSRALNGIDQYNTFLLLVQDAYFAICISSKRYTLSQGTFHCYVIWLAKLRFLYIFLPNTVASVLVWSLWFCSHLNTTKIYQLYSFLKIFSNWIHEWPHVWIFYELCFVAFKSKCGCIVGVKMYIFS